MQACSYGSFNRHYFTSSCKWVNVIISESRNNDLHTLIIVISFRWYDTSIFPYQTTEKWVNIACILEISLRPTAESFFSQSDINSLNGRFQSESRHSERGSEDFWFMLNNNHQRNNKANSLSLIPALCRRPLSLYILYLFHASASPRSLVRLESNKS